MYYFFFFKQKTAYEMRISDWSSDVCSSDLHGRRADAKDARPDRLWQYRQHRRRTRAGPAHEGRRLRPLPDPRTRDRAGRRKGRSRHFAGKGGLPHPAHPVDRPDAEHPVEANSGEDQARRADRKSVVEGTSVSVRVVLGVSSIIKKKKKI